jgi:hypothetical protein
MTLQWPALGQKANEVLSAGLAVFLAQLVWRKVRGKQIDREYLNRSVNTLGWVLLGIFLVQAYRVFAGS